MRVTGQPFIELGIATSEAEPVYPVIVMASLFVSQVNWARAAAAVLRKSARPSRVN